VDNSAVTRIFEYEKDANGNNTGRIDKQEVMYTGGSIVGATTNYTYDTEGRITRVDITENGTTRTVTYQYGLHDRLIQEDNFRYHYNNDGNILWKRTTAGVNVNTYTYQGNRLMRFNSPNTDNFAYDAMGNPTLYKGNPMVWDFKNLRSYKGAMFEYNASGLRQTKTHNRTVTKYYWSNDKLLAEEHTITHPTQGGFHIHESGFHIREEGFHIIQSNTHVEQVYIEYAYGVSGMMGFTLRRDNGVVERYWYTKNIQGDITHIHRQEPNNDMTLVARYTYDAWGNCTVENITGEEIANINPIRYREYYFTV